MLCISENFSRDSRVLKTGCGTGIIAFHLVSLGFSKVVGTDLLPEAIQVANWISTNFSVDSTEFFVDDGLQPTIESQFELIAALHWVPSAWMGNYGNPVSIGDKGDEERVRLLVSFLSQYTSRLTPGSILIFEVTDAEAEYRLAADHPEGNASLGIYPIRQTPKQVAICAAANNLKTFEKQLCIRYGHQPRTTSFPQKNP